MSRNYLVYHDYGQGAIGWRVFARSADMILRRVPMVNIMGLNPNDLDESDGIPRPQVDLDEPDGDQFHQSFVDNFENEDGRPCEVSVIKLDTGGNAYLVQLYIEGCKIYRYVSADSGDQILEMFPELDLIGDRRIFSDEQILKLEKGIAHLSDFESPAAFMSDFSDLDGHDDRDDVFVYCRHGRMPDS